jgi:stage II sporulation protein M
MERLLVLKQNLDEFLRRWSGTILGLSALYLAGAILGALAVSAVGSQDRVELSRYLTTVLNWTHPEAVQGAVGALFWRSLQGNLQILLFLWLAGLSLIGILGVWGLSLLRGFLTGFTMAFLAAQFGTTGFWLALAGLLPGLLLQVPGLILGGTAAVAFALSLLRAWREGRRPASFYPVIGAYSITLLILGSGLLFSSLLEAFLAPRLIGLVLAHVPIE